MYERNYQQELIIELMQTLEDSVAKLYEIYAQKFPQHANFWMTLALQENMHADWVRGLAALINNGTITFNADRFKIEQLQMSLDYLHHRLELTQEEHETTMNEAVSVALQLEESLIEKNFFEIFEGDSEEMKEVLSDLSDDTKEHISKIKHIQEQLSS